MNDLAVVIRVKGVEFLVCSIECARHHGFEPVRLPLPTERDIPCAFGCNNDPDEED